MTHASDGPVTLVARLIRTHSIALPARRCPSTHVLALLLAVCFLGTACDGNATLTQIHDLAETVNKSLESFTSLPVDLYQNCIHLAAWDVDRVPSQFSNPTLQTPAPAAGSDSDSQAPFPRFPPIDTKLRKWCGVLDVGLQQWADANTVVIEYVDALNDLVGGKKPKPARTFTDLAKSIKDAYFVSFSKDNPPITADQVVAAGGLLDKAIELGFAQERAKQALTFAQKANDGIMTMLTLLYRAAGQYNYLLNEEFRLIETRFVVGDPQKPRGNLTSTESEIWYSSIARIAADRHKLDQYVNVLNVVAHVQKKLVTASTADGRPEELAKLLWEPTAMIALGPDASHAGAVSAPKILGR